ncbi:helix-turn-helix transcriptional regulator [Streptomyces sp. NPDC051907]|uniref:helix-turn-helix transcriptional regulator n=1 Tax=Streptomyces sp. NPDC051907 TaxID=3155284 RepID=UPI00343A4B0B
MGAAMESSRQSLTDSERSLLGRAALRDGTAARVRRLRGWTVDDMARECNVTTHLLTGWESGTEHPSPASSLKVWEVLVAACTAPETP